MPEGAGVTVTGLQVAHAAELIPAGAKQRRYLPALGDGFGGGAAMPEGVAVARRAATALSAAVHPTPLPPRPPRRLAQRPPPGPGMATGCLVQARRIGVFGCMGLILRFRYRPDCARCFHQRLGEWWRLWPTA